MLLLLLVMSLEAMASEAYNNCDLTNVCMSVSEGETEVSPVEEEEECEGLGCCWDSLEMGCFRKGEEREVVLVPGTETDKRGDLHTTHSNSPRFSQMFSI